MALNDYLASVSETNGGINSALSPFNENGLLSGSWTSRFCLGSGIRSWSGSGLRALIRVIGGMVLVWSLEFWYWSGFCVFFWVLVLVWYWGFGTGRPLSHKGLGNGLGFGESGLDCTVDSEEGNPCTSK